MARLFPQDHGSATLSPGARAELATLEALQAALPDAYTIFHGVHWADEGPRGTPVGELDFAIVNQAGAILLVEQKAGDLEETAAGLTKVYGARSVTVADQVHRALNHVQAKYASTYPGHKPQLDYLLYLPHHRVEHVQAAGLDASRIVHAGSDDTLAARIERILGAGKPDKERAEASRAFFRQQLQLAPSIDHAVATHERVYTRLSEGLATVADRLDMQPWRLKVTARAGAGKTQLAQRFLEHRTHRNPLSPHGGEGQGEGALPSSLSPHEGEGQGEGALPNPLSPHGGKGQGEGALPSSLSPHGGEGQGEGAPPTDNGALYTCFNRPLAEQMETLLPTTTVHTFHDLCRRILESAGEPFEVETRAGDPDFWQEVVTRTERILLDHGPHYDTLVVDEGQDFTPEWYELLRLCVTDDADILWLEDPLQDLHKRPPVELPGFATWHTRENHRSPCRIARYIERELGIAFETRNDLPGDPVEHIAYKSAQDQIERAGEQVQALIDRGYSPEQITLLTVHGLERSPFARVESVGGHRLRRHAGYTEDGHQQMTAGALTFDSIHRHKGQQAPAVILADVDYPDWREERARNILYTAMTRAGLHLTILHAAKMM